MLAFLTLALNAGRGAASWAASFFAAPPGSYIGAALLVLLALWGVHHHGYDSGRTACEQAHAARTEQAVLAEHAAGEGAVARSAVRAQHDSQTDNKAMEVIRYVASEAKSRPDSGDECVPAPLADRLRDIP